MAVSGGEAAALLAVHAGWRGTAQEVSRLALEAFFAACQKRLNKPQYLAALGPCIGFASFEVGQEVIDAFPHALAQGLARPAANPGKYYFDLAGENARQVRAAAKNEALELDVLSHCTFLEKERFPSFRRDRENREGARRILSFLQREG